jgi:CRISPR-associated protein Cas1
MSFSLSGRKGKPGKSRLAKENGKMSALLARLGLETARIPHADRHGFVWLSMGQLHVKDGCLRFATAGFDGFAAGDYALPHQTVSSILLGPGGSVTQDALRILGRHGTCLVAVGEGGVRAYTAPPLRPDTSALARRQVRVWADEDTRLSIARRMYHKRLLILKTYVYISG